jgi:hypothetical protein
MMKCWYNDEDMMILLMNVVGIMLIYCMNNHLNKSVSKFIVNFIKALMSVKIVMVVLGVLEFEQLNYNDEWLSQWTMLLLSLTQWYFTNFSSNEWHDNDMLSHWHNV